MALRYIELAPRSRDGLLERLSAVRQPRIRVLDGLHIPVCVGIPRRVAAFHAMQREVGLEVRTAKSELRLLDDERVDFGLSKFLLLRHQRLTVPLCRSPSIPYTTVLSPP